MYSSAVTTATDPDDTRARLLAAARGVFAAQGVQGARMTDVAKAAEVSRQALYYHFHSKRELASELVRAGLDDLAREVRAGLAVGPVELIVPVLLRFYARNADLARILLLQQVDVGLDLARLRDVGLDVLVGPLATRLAADAEAGRVGPLDARTAALSIVGAVNACAVDVLFRDAGSDLEALTDELVAYVRRITAVPPRPATSRRAAPAQETER